MKIVEGIVQRIGYQVTFFCVLAIANLAIAQPSNDRQPSNNDQELPKSGNLSTSLKSGAVNATIPDIFGGEDISDNNQSPITGSVSRTNNESWTMKVFNNSKDQYSVNLDVIQSDVSGATVKSDSYSYNLKPGRSEQRAVSAGIGARDAALNLRSYRNLSAERRKRSEQDKQSEKNN